MQTGRTVAVLSNRILLLLIQDNNLLLLHQIALHPVLWLCLSLMV